MLKLVHSKGSTPSSSELFNERGDADLVICQVLELVGHECRCQFPGVLDLTGDPEMRKGHEIHQVNYFLLREKRARVIESFEDFVRSSFDDGELLFETGPWGVLFPGRRAFAL